MGWDAARGRDRELWQAGSVTQDPGEELQRDGCLQGSGTRVRERWIKSKPLAALSS